MKCGNRRAGLGPKALVTTVKQCSNDKVDDKVEHYKCIINVAYRMSAIPMTLSNLEGHFWYLKPS